MEHDEIFALFDIQNIKAGDLVEIILNDGKNIKAVIRTPRPFGALAERHFMSYDHEVSSSRLDLLPPDVLPIRGSIQPEAFTVYSKDVKSLNKIINIS